MTAPINLGFTQMIGAGGAAPAAGAAPSAAEFGGALLSQLPSVAIGFATGGPVGAGISLAKGLIGMVIGNGTGDTGGENSADAGKNIPFLDNSNPLETVEDSISALQSALVGLFVSDSANTAAQGITTTSEPLGMVENSQQATTQAFTGKTLDAYRAAAGLSQPAVETQAENQLFTQTQTPAPATTTTGAESNVELGGNAADDAFLPVTNTNAQAANKESMAAMLKTEADMASKPKSSDPLLQMLAAKDSNPEGLAESVRKLKSLSAMTPIPSGYGYSKPDQNGEVQTPLDKLAGMQSEIAPVKPAVDKIMAKQAPAADSLAMQNNNAQAAQASAASEPVNIASSVKPDAAVKPIEAHKVEAEAPNDLGSLNQARSEAPAKTAAAPDFSQHLNRAMNASPAEQVAAKLTQLPSGKQHITVELDPVDLGKVHVKVEWAPDGKTQINIAAERKETLDALKADAGTLSRALADSGIKADASNLQFSFKGQEFNAGTFAEHKGNGSHNGSHANAQHADNNKESADTARLAQTLHINGLVDLRV